MARNGEIPGAIRLDGYHYKYPVTPELLDWIEWKRRKVQQRKRPVKEAKLKWNIGVTTIQGIRQEFDVWLRRVGGIDGILKMPPECLEDIVIEIQPIEKLHSQIMQALTKRDSTKRT
jgi:hypothetical protein